MHKGLSRVASVRPTPEHSQPNPIYSYLNSFSNSNSSSSISGSRANGLSLGKRKGRRRRQRALNFDLATVSQREEKSPSPDNAGGQF